MKIVIALIFDLAWFLMKSKMKRLTSPQHFQILIIYIDDSVEHTKEQPLFALRKYEHCY